MKVTLTDVQAELGNNGVVLYIADNDGKHRGKLRIGQATIEWCRGRTRIGQRQEDPDGRFSRRPGSHLTARYANRVRRLSACCSATCSTVSCGSWRRRWAWVTSAGVGWSSFAGQVAGLHSLDRTNAFGQCV